MESEYDNVYDRCHFLKCVLQCEVGHCQRVDEDGSEVRCSECLGPLTKGAQQIHDNSDEDGDLVWVCGTCVAAWQRDDREEGTNDIPF